MEMIKAYRLLFSLVLALSFAACIKNDFSSLPDYATSNLNNTIAVDTAYRRSFEGIYHLSFGNDLFGQQLVAKWANGYLCFFSEKDGRFINLEMGYKTDDSSFRMAGFWYDPLLVQHGQVQFTLTRADGADSVFAGRSSGITLRGYLENDPGRPLVLIFVRPLSEYVLSRNFSIAAHRGGGRNSDNIPYAENSLNLVRHVEQFGATSIEIDIRLTKDKVPIVYHDADINTRLTLKSPLVGDIHQFDARFLRAYIKLVDGQFIPTLDEMLTMVIDSTTIADVWLDCKDGGEDRFFENVVPLLKKALGYAKNKGRNVSILIGLPTEDAFTKFIALPGYRDIPSLCEINLEKTKAAGSTVFAPRWTLGILDAETDNAHANNIRVVTWTLDDSDGMEEVITKSHYDGILTNYPSILAYHFYSQE